MKLRISRDLHARARACAEAVGDTLSRWISLALRQYMAGRLDAITPDESLLAASEHGAVITIPDNLTNPATIRQAIARAVLYCEARNPRPYTPDLKEGRDYLIARPE